MTLPRCVWLQGRWRCGPLPRAGAARPAPLEGPGAGNACPAAAGTKAAAYSGRAVARDGFRELFIDVTNGPAVANFDL